MAPGLSIALLVQDLYRVNILIFQIWLYNWDRVSSVLGAAEMSQFL
jgi:hypothetical protein